MLCVQAQFKNSKKPKLNTKCTEEIAATAVVDTSFAEAIVWRQARPREPSKTLFSSRVPTQACVGTRVETRARHRRKGTIVRRTVNPTGRRHRPESSAQIRRIKRQRATQSSPRAPRWTRRTCISLPQHKVASGKLKQNQVRTQRGGGKETRQTK